MRAGRWRGADLRPVSFYFRLQPRPRELRNRHFTADTTDSQKKD